MNNGIGLVLIIENIHHVEVLETRTYKDIWVQILSLTPNLYDLNTEMT